MATVERQVLDLVSDAYTEAVADAQASEKRAGEEARAWLIDHPDADLQKLVNLTDQQLGAAITEHAYKGTHTGGPTHAAYDQGYRDACAKVHEVLTAFFKGLN